MSSHEEIAACMEVVGGWNSALRKVNLRDIDGSWRPGAERERVAFELLLSQDRRRELRQWYSVISELNPFAEEFRQYLERCIGEPLPLKQSHHRGVTNSGNLGRK